LRESGARADLAPRERVTRIACDESGSEGEKLIGSTTDVFAHASVRTDVETAACHLLQIRTRAPTRSLEYKAYHILRERRRSALVWLLAPSGPLHGNAHVHLTDKVFLVLGRVVDLLLGQPAHPDGVGLRLDHLTRDTALALYREGEPAVGQPRWESFLLSCNNLMRGRNRQDGDAPVDAFFGQLADLRSSVAPGRVGDILALLADARPRAEALRAGLSGGPAGLSGLDPLIPALLAGIAYWSGRDGAVSVVHDRHNALSAHRVAAIQELFDRPDPAPLGGAPRGRLVDVRLADSRSDPRVQVADVLAGAARKIASDELNGRGDEELTALLRPYVDARSVWGDDRSWSVLGPTPMP
jgi:hypothetical protein